MEKQFADFVRDVALMRAAQNRYFKSRTTLALKESKAIEARVDTAILLFKSSGLLPVEPKTEQKNLF